MEEKFFLGSGEEVRDRADSHVATHTSVHAVLAEALKKIHASERGFIIEEIQMGRIIGETICVATGPGDQIIFGKRPNRWGLTRFVKNRKSEQSSSVVVILKKAEGNDFFTLITAFVGAMAPPEPWDQRTFSQKPDPKGAEKESKEFWSTHALVYGCEEILKGTETSKCPW